ncbi:MAG: 4-hydroxy-tetrahydrodipicolinate synthase [Bacteroidales bacterium]|nr:4-hydroxy-tetrahydrodipicolinate synthase [Bacteroidales bacterium]MBO5849176.1 4-hydroxy-tetrahydrodipicolinate synthase [Bacteroidales bacterium]
MKNNPFVGTGVALITPFNEDFSVDYKSLENIVEFTLSNGADFMVALGTTSEAPTLTQEEKNNVLKTIVKVAKGRCPIMLGMGGNNTMALLQNIKNQDFTDIDGILSVVPYYNKPNQRGMKAHFEAVADNSPVPVILYNVPGRVGVNLQASTCVELAKHKNIIAVKEASGNLQQIMEILRDKPSDFDVLSGDDGLTQPMMALGAKGVISVAANGYPDVFCKMVKSMLNDDAKTALPLHYKMLNMNSLIFADGNPAGIKCLMAQQNLCKNVLRLPLVTVNDNVKNDLEKEYKILYNK